MSSFRSSLWPGSWSGKFLLLLLSWAYACNQYGQHTHLFAAHRFVLSRNCLFRISGEEEEKSRLLLTDISPQTKAANIISQKPVLGYLPRCLPIAPFFISHIVWVLSMAQDSSVLPRQVPQRAFSPHGKCAWDQRESEQAGAFLGKPIYCICRTGLNVSTLHLHSKAISPDGRNY